MNLWPVIGCLVAENGLAVYLLAVMFKANITLPSVYLSQKWVTGGINIHYTPNDAISGNILIVHSSSVELLQRMFGA